MDYFKFILICTAFLFFSHEALSQSSFCATEEKEISTSLLEIFKKKFYEQLNEHFDNLVKSNYSSESERAGYLKRYENLVIKVCPNPHNNSQKVVYIEYEKDWWGRLYLALVVEGEVLKWMDIETYGAVTRHVRWNKDSFFYEDSTHMGTKTQNTCVIQEDSVNCKKQ